MTDGAGTVTDEAKWWPKSAVNEAFDMLDTALAAYSVGDNPDISDEGKESASLLACVAALVICDNSTALLCDGVPVDPAAWSAELRAIMLREAFHADRLAGRSPWR